MFAETTLSITKSDNSANLGGRVLGLDQLLLLYSFSSEDRSLCSFDKDCRSPGGAKGSEGSVSGIEAADTEACSETASAEPSGHCLELLELSQGFLASS